MRYYDPVRVLIRAFYKDIRNYGRTDGTYRFYFRAACFEAPVYFVFRLRVFSNALEYDAAVLKAFIIKGVTDICFADTCLFFVYEPRADKLCIELIYGLFTLRAGRSLRHVLR